MTKNRQNFSEINSEISLDYNPLDSLNLIEFDSSKERSKLEIKLSSYYDK